MFTKQQIHHCPPYFPLGDLASKSAHELLTQEQIDYLIGQGEEILREYQWPIILASTYMEFSQTGDRNHFQSIYYPKRFHLTLLALAEWAENKGRFVPMIADGLWSICEESSWVIPAHNNNHPTGMPEKDALPNFEKEPYIDLFAAETAAVLSWVVYFTRAKLDALSPIICRRVHKELEQRIMQPYLKVDTYHWMGISPASEKVNNWNPWINSNILPTFLLMQKNEQTRRAGVQKVLRSLSAFADGYGEDGGCDEGAHYWEEGVAAFLDSLEMLYEWSAGEIEFYSHPKIRNMAKFITRMHVCENRYINFGDGGMKLNMPGELLFRVGEKMQDAQLQNWGVYIYQTGKRQLKRPTYHVYRYLNQLLNHQKMLGQQYSLTRETYCYLDSIQVMVARESERFDEGLVLGCKGGHNGESHNHNDTGNYTIYHKGVPIVIDAGVERYSAKTFSEQRYTIWTMQSAYHNLPIICGAQQKDGAAYGAKNVVAQATPQQRMLSTQLAGAYPLEGMLKSYSRQVCMDTSQEACIWLRETIQLEKADSDVVFRMMVHGKPKLEANGVLLAPDTDAALLLEYDQDLLQAQLETILLEDLLMQENWGSQLYCLSFSLRSAQQQIDTVFRFTKIKSKR